MDSASGCKNTEGIGDVSLFQGHWFWERILVFLQHLGKTLEVSWLRQADHVVLNSLCFEHLRRPKKQKTNHNIVILHTVVRDFPEYVLQRL